MSESSADAAAGLPLSWGERRRDEKRQQKIIIELLSDDDDDDDDSIVVVETIAAPKTPPKKNIQAASIGASKKSTIANKDNLVDLTGVPSQVLVHSEETSKAFGSLRRSPFKKGTPPSRSRLFKKKKSLGTHEQASVGTRVKKPTQLQKKSPPKLLSQSFRKNVASLKTTSTSKPPPLAQNVARRPETKCDSDSSDDDVFSRKRRRKRTIGGTLLNKKKPRAKSMPAFALAGNHSGNGTMNESLSDYDQKKPAAVATAAKETVDLLSSSDSEQEVPNKTESENNNDVAAATNDETLYIAQELAKFPRPRNIGPYPFEEAQDLFDQALAMFKEGHGKDFEAFQRSSIFREFTPEDATDSQTMAQYGYAKPRFTKELVEKIYPLDKKGMVFADVGSGDGRHCILVALLTGNESRGVEILKVRHATSIQLNTIIQDLHEGITDRSHLCSDDGMQEEYAIGEVKLECGRFEVPDHREFLSEVDLLFCNNYNEVFGARSRVPGSQYELNDFLIGLLCLMKPGAALVTLDKLKVQDEEEAREHRKRVGLDRSEMDSSHFASFFDLKTFYYRDTPENAEMFDFRKTFKDFKVYRYTRNQEKATFLCGTPRCDVAKAKEPIEAWQELDDGKVVLGKCECCELTSIAQSQRERKRTVRYGQEETKTNK